ncbi:hypothetical protein TNCV_5101021 [Trichonephila clavipes]|uniref:Uncharacterized protein n=1 Tax=Trichonephila clavipes TaxID=2585209 RepID=A0A8X6VBW7_TRICX|nr:hypothetical protein TNCV_5101021 [Trichonephila clavipes]
MLKSLRFDIFELQETGYQYDGSTLQINGDLFKDKLTWDNSAEDERGYPRCFHYLRAFGNEPRHFELGSVTRMTSELAPLSPNNLTTPTRGRLNFHIFSVHRSQHGESSVVLGSNS